MSRSASESRRVVVPGCTTQAPPLHALLNAATPATFVGPVRVPVPAVQLTEYRQNWTAVLVKLIRKFGDPAGGSVVPSRSAGSRLWPPVVLTQACRADAPISILSRSKAQTVLPVNEWPLRNML